MIKNYKYVFFDLDGTLTDPRIGITKSIDYALRFYGIETADLDSLCKFIGPPLIKTFEIGYGFNEETAIMAVEKYREYFNVKGIYENEVYPGIEDLLQKLRGQGKRIILATSKPAKFAKIILEYFNLIQYFDFISGSEMDGRRTEKSEVIEYAIVENHIEDISEVLMIGDRKFDVEGAKIVGIDCVGVLYGFGDIEELTEAGADYIFEKVEDILGLFVNE